MKNTPEILKTAAVLIALVVHGVWGLGHVRSADETLSTSATVPRDRDIEARFQSARELVASGNHASAVAAFRQLLDSDSRVLLAVGNDPVEPSRERYCSISEGVRALLADLSPEAKRLYEQQVGQPAIHQVTAAIRRGDRQAIRRLVERAPGTEAEFVGLKFLAATALEVGEFELAAAAAQRAMRHQKLDAQQRRLLTEFMRRASLGQEQRNQRSESRLPSVSGSGQERSGEATRSDWTVSDLLSSDELGLFNEAQTELAQQSISLRVRTKPVIQDGVICLRALRHLTAFDLRTGRELWSTRRTMDENGPFSSNQSLRELMARSIGRQSQLDSVLTSVMVSDDLVVSVDIARPSMVVVPPDMLRAGNSQGGISTVIQARQLTNGKAEWSFGQDKLASVDVASKSEFLGVPTRFDEQLWGLAQTDSTLTAYAIDRGTGRLITSCRVGETTRGHAADSDWRLLSCSPQRWRGYLVYPTSTGLIVGIDPVTQQTAWTVRYPRHDTPSSFMQVVGTASGNGRRRWWEFWREPQLIVSDRSDDPLLVVTPDRRDLSAIDESGALVWKRTIEDSLFVAGIRNGRILVIGQHSASLLDAQTGAILGFVASDAPSGEGDWSRTSTTSYAYPSARGISTIDVEQVASQEATSSSPSALRSMLPTDVGLAAQSRLIETAAGTLLVRPDSLELAGSSAKQFKTWELNEPQQEAHARLNELLSRARQAAGSGDAVGAMQTYLEMLNLNPTGMRLVHEAGPSRHVRFDRLIAGDVFDLLVSVRKTAAQLTGNATDGGTGDKTGEQRLIALINNAKQAAVKSPDPFAIQRFAERFGQLPGAREIWLDRQVRIGVGFAKSLLPLLALRDEALLAPATSLELAEMFHQRTYHDDARAILLPLRARQSELAVTSNPQFDSRLQKLLTELPAATSANKAIWPDRRAKVSDREMAAANVAFKPLHVEAEAGSLLSRLDVGWHASGSTIRFIGDGRSGEWTLSLPATRSFLRRADVLAHGWGIGQILIVRLGTELFAITPLDENGEQRARLLWTVDMAPQAQLQAHGVIPARLGFSEQNLHLLDAFDRPIGLVGPVCASYLCYRAEGRLVCLETASGQTLWDRSEFPFAQQPDQQIVTGNEQTICVTTGKTTTLVRSLDGATVATRTQNRESDWLHQVGTLQVQRVANDRFEGVDLASGTVLWSRDISAGDLPFAVDSTTWGVLDASGVARFLNLRTGELEGEIPVNRPARVELLLCQSDEDRRLLVISGPRPQATAATLFEAMLTRTAIVDGAVTAIDRHSGQVVWTRNLRSTNWLLDQPRCVPLLMAVGTADGGGTDLQIIEKQTGNELLRRPLAPREGWPLIRPNAGPSWISLRTATHEFKIDYAE